MQFEPDEEQLYVEGTLPLKSGPLEDLRIDDFHVAVPLVMYIEGNRHVIGEAVVDGKNVTATLGDKIGDQVLDWMTGRDNNWSIVGVPKYHFPVEAVVGHNPKSTMDFLKDNVLKETIREKFLKKLLKEIEKPEFTQE